MSRSAQLVATLLLLALLLAWQHPLSESVAMWWELGRPPHPWLTSPESAGLQLAHGSTAHAFDSTFYYGEACGRHTPIAEAAQRGAALPSHLRPHFYDGLAHGLRVDANSLDSVLRELEEAIPAAYLSILYDGVLRDLTEQAQGEPEEVVAQVESITEQVDLRTPYNGVRIGLQRAQGHDLPHAIATAARYPEHYWPALYEELGWRSTAPNPDAGAAPEIHPVSSLAALVPDSVRCHFVHGATRGLVLEQAGLDRASWQTTDALLDQLDPACRTAGYQGIAWGVFLLAAHEPTRVEWMLSQIPDTEARRVVEESYHRIASPISLRTTTVSSPATPISPWELHKLQGDGLPAR